MVYELPAPPPGMRFRRDSDEAGRPRLTWPARFTRKHCLRAVVAVIGLCIGLFFLLWLIRYEIDYSPDGPLGEMIWTQLRRVNGKLIGLSFVLCLLLLFLLLVIILFVRGLLFQRGTVQNRLTFEGDVLRYRGQALLSSRSDDFISRGDIRAVSMRRQGGLLIAGAGARAAGGDPAVILRRQDDLLIAESGMLFEIDPTLTSDERKWLAEVIRDWAGLARPVTPPDVAPLPAASWLQLERDRDGCLRLSWLPPEEIREAGRRGVRRRALTWLIGWIFAETGLVALLAYLVLGNLAWLGCVLWLADAALGLGLLICTSAGLAILAELVSLRRRARPESITLGPDRLHHDPGHCHCGATVSLGVPCDIDRAEIARVLLEDGPDAQVELQLHGVTVRSKPRLAERRQTAVPVTAAVPVMLYHTVRVGSCLRSFERVWLADTLRWWAGLPSDEP